MFVVGAYGCGDDNVSTTAQGGGDPYAGATSAFAGSSGSLPSGGAAAGVVGTSTGANQSGTAAESGGLGAAGGSGNTTNSITGGAGGSKASGAGAGGTGAVAGKGEIGIIWASYDPSHYQNSADYISKVDSYKPTRVTIVPTYFIDTYEKGILTSWNGAQKVPDGATIKGIIKDFLTKGYAVNYRPHVDPIKFAMPTGTERDNWSTDPGGKDWRGKFDKFDPMSSTIKYREVMIKPNLNIIAEAIREVGIDKVNPVRFDLGAELMDSLLNYSANWIKLQKEIRDSLAGEYKDVADKILLSQNFCHHMEYLTTLPNHKEYLARIEPDGVMKNESLYLDRPGVTDATRKQIGQYIAGLDEFSISQYMPLDIKSTSPNETTPEQVRDALLEHESNYINEVLIKTCGMKKEEIPPFHLGEFGIGILGIKAPNVWDRAAWEKAGKASQIPSDADQKKQAEAAIKGAILYMKDSRTVARSVMLWLGGKPYDIFPLNSYSEGWNNPGAVQALKDFWDGK